MLRVEAEMAIAITTLSGATVSCEGCSGFMERSDPPFSGDFDEKGVLEPFCHDCGGGFKHENEVVDSCLSTYVKSISDVKLLGLHHSVCTRSCQPWLRGWLDKQRFLMMIRECCCSRRDLIEFYLDNPYNEDIDFLEDKISIF